MSKFTTDELLVLLNMSLTEGSYCHYDPITQEFYNQCHDGSGRFCPTSGSGGNKGSGGISGATKLKDPDGKVAPITSDVKRGKRGASLADPHEGTKEVEGIKGYDKKSGKPVAGTDAWLEAHGVTKEIFNSRPYVKYERDKNDPALREAYKDNKKAESFFSRTAEQEGQAGGYIMYKNPVPGTPIKDIIDAQARPNAAIVTNPATRAYREKLLTTNQERLETLKTVTPAALKRERVADLKQKELNLERIKTATPEKVRAEAERNLAKAQAAFDKAKASGNAVKALETKKELTSEKRRHAKEIKRADTWMADKELYDAETGVKYAQNRLQRVINDPKGALEAEIKSQESQVKRSQNQFDKTAAKYVFPPGSNSARIDMNPDPQNVKNLTQGKGRIYFAMEGAIKADAVLTTLKKEDPTASVVNVPSVTLWQQKSATGGLDDGKVTSEVAWFAGKYGKGREIVLIPDADGVTNPAVMQQAKGLSTALTRSGAGKVIVASAPLKANTKKQIDHFNLPSGVQESRKGVDDHLGAGRGTLGQLQYTTVNKVPKYDLSEFTGIKKSEGPKMNKNAQKNAEAALAALSGIVGPQGASQVPKKLLMQTAGLKRTSASDSRRLLEDLGIIKVEHIFDEQALSRRRRIRNPKVSDERVEQLVRDKIIKEPRLDKPFSEVSMDESPVITILDKRFVIKQDDVETGTLSDLKSWSPPKTFKGWTSPVNGASDTTGIAASQEEQRVKTNAKKTSLTTENNAKKVVKTTEERLASKKAPKGRRLVRSAAGAKKYGVAIGQPIPVGALAASGLITSMIDLAEVLAQEEMEEFYNQCHDSGGKFCPTSGGSGSNGSGISGKAKVNSGNYGVTKQSATKTTAPLKGWPKSGGRPITTIASVSKGSVKVDGIKAKAVYEVTAKNGNKIRLYDKVGNAGPYKNDLLQTQARMNEMYPLKPARNIVVTKPASLVKDSEIPSKNVFSQVYSNYNPTFINSQKLGYNVGNLRDGFFMPSAKDGNTKDMSYLMTHEYGHHVDFSKHYNKSTDTYTSHPLYQNNSFTNAISRYGRQDPRGVESYAESFAEWHQTSGKTTNPAAIALARYEGWHGSSVLASGQTEIIDSEVISLVNYGLVQFDILSFETTDSGGYEVFPDDTDEDINADIPSVKEGMVVVEDFETGAKILGGTDKESSQAEIYKANKIMEEVMQELKNG